MHRSYKILVTDDDDDVTMISSLASMSITHHFQFDLINAKKRDKKSYKNSGQIVVKSVKIEQVRMVRMMTIWWQCDQMMIYHYNVTKLSPTDTFRRWKSISGDFNVCLTKSKPSQSLTWTF